MNSPSVGDSRFFGLNFFPRPSWYWFSSVSTLQINKYIVVVVTSIVFLFPLFLKLVTPSLLKVFANYTNIFFMAAKAKESLLSEEELSLTSYYFKNGLRLLINICSNHQGYDALHLTTLNLKSRLKDAGSSEN